MAITIHCLLLGIAALVPATVVVRGLGQSRASAKSLVCAALPFVVLGCISLLLMQIAGPPFIEWFLPGVSAVLVTALDGGQRLSGVVRRSLLLLALVLCGEYLWLVNWGGYTANPRAVKDLTEGQCAALKIVARTRLIEAYGDLEAIPQGYIGNLLKDPSFTTHLVNSARPEWHTCFTRLMRVEKENAVLWHEGRGQIKVRLMCRSW